MGLPLLHTQRSTDPLSKSPRRSPPPYNSGQEVEVGAAADVRTLDGYSAVVLGGALYMGRWHKDAAAFLKRYRQPLAELPLAIFAMGPATMEEADVAASRQQLDHALEAAPELSPAAVAIFGGVVDPSKLRFPFTRMAASDARDWEAVGRGATTSPRCSPRILPRCRRERRPRSSGQRQRLVRRRVGPLLRSVTLIRHRPAFRGALVRLPS